MRDITVYSKTSCAYCALAKQILNDRGLAFHEIDITAKPDTARELVAKTGQRTVPQIYIGGQFIGGYAELAALSNDRRLALMLTSAAA